MISLEILPQEADTLSQLPDTLVVMRNTDLRWHAFRGRKGVDYIGTFTSEKDAALAHDFYARKAGDTHLINFPREQMSEKDMQKRKTKQYEEVTLPAKGKSIYRGVHLQKNRKRWMAKYSLSHKKEKRTSRRRSRTRRNQPS